MIHRRGFNPIRLLIQVILVAVGLVMVFPLFWLVSTSLRPAPELLEIPPQLLPQHWTLDNYANAFAAAPFGTWLLNSLIFATISTMFILLTSLVGGYILAKFKFPGNNFLFILILATAIVPFEIYMLPVFLEVQALSLINTLPGLILPYVILSYGIFFMRQNVLASVPDELLDAARIDGLSETGIMIRLVSRLLAPAISALAIFAYLQSWTAFIWPLLVLNDQNLFPVQLGLAQFNSSVSVNYAVLSAGAVVAMAPTVIAFLVLRRRIIEGVTLTGFR
ncbi:MAG TPA: carbohydrate ABC transporter permease [Candidatus Limnocylindrales bacterium]|jgi:multiple sugar transport system permease protein